MGVEGFQLLDSAFETIVNITHQPRCGTDLTLQYSLG
jgi:hypothetical protein